MDNLDKVIQIDMQQFLRKSFAKNGVERTEDIIRSVYNQSPKLKRIYLEEYKKLMRRKK